MKRTALLSAAALLFVACATTSPPVATPHGGSAGTPQPKLAPKPAPLPEKPAVPARLRCQDDADCEISAFTGCCHCCTCPSTPYAINKLFSQTQRNRCAAVRCGPCNKACTACPEFVAGSPGRAVCRDHRCTRVVDEKTRPKGAFESSD
ncbi:MAG: hypothetical protein KAI47_06830 [Deltaproteobacteria bacterium]|nr:hypothetical protein [Deltaproteobacteria bacterium]